MDSAFWRDISSTENPHSSIGFVRQDCPNDGIMSETKKCVAKPWSDFLNCEEEKRQGACPGGFDPKPWVGQHCAITCSARN